MAKLEEELHPIALRMKELQVKFDKIEAKDKCLRVRFLDWLSDKMLHLSESVKEASIRIDSPCIIKFDNKPKFDNNPEKLTTEQADYFFDPSSHNFIDIKGLKAGKSHEECTYTMHKGRGLVSLAQSKKERDVKHHDFINRVDAKIADLKKELEEIK